jgi:hypothetical protein
MRDYFGEFLKNPALGSSAGFGNTGSRPQLGDGGGLSWKHKLLWVVTVVGTGVGSWQAAKFHSKVKGALKGAKTASRKKKKSKRLAKD